MAAFALSTFATACQTTKTTHGQIIGQQQLSALKPGVQKKADIRAILGSPSATSTLNGDRWFYVTAKSVDKPIIGSTIQSQEVYLIDFDENGTFTKITQRDANKDGEKIAPSEEVTPTQGEKLGIIERTLENLGAGF